MKQSRLLAWSSTHVQQEEWALNEGNNLICARQDRVITKEVPLHSEEVVKRDGEGSDLLRPTMSGVEPFHPFLAKVIFRTVRVSSSREVEG
jgi:hypothetical protein